MAGPHVDLHCPNRYVLCFAGPLAAGLGQTGSRAVVAADVPLAGLERLFVPPLRALVGDAAVVNGEGRVLAADTVSWPVGRLARALVAEGGSAERAQVPARAVVRAVVRAAG
ncbi:hypothetical protein [Streptomyces sp. CB01881]|uniref:hypothetical protein n=1 Tax=Streptomyces sp. CB01881 TaxID=2078691 RepID=UPI000CDC4C27|nr:hypothetical protein [Streptomyces sp. CB01881]AUY48599.1 hypothetical protein C2142_06170 [Streptomyces sp. CB01881]TYC77092.1 hypothetical protein EH183_06180 [Streptomyces sp. CB01881]